jgi:hypothetical protein
MKIVDFDPAQGFACQGDVIIAKLPEGYRINRSDCLQQGKGRIILALGEETGHHHSILARVFEPLRFRDDAVATSDLLTESRALLYWDLVLLNRLVCSNWLLSGAHRLCIGFLTVEGGPVLLEHLNRDQWSGEHDAIRMPPGEYYVGRQEFLDANSGLLSYELD